MSKGFAKYLASIIFMLVLFIIVNYVIADSLGREIHISDFISQIYKMVNSVEAARVHSTQLLKLSVDAAKRDLRITDVSAIKNDVNLKNQFLDKVKSYFRPSLSYSTTDISIKVVSVDLEDTKVVSILELDIGSLDPTLSGSKIYGDVKVFSGL